MNKNPFVPQPSYTPQQPPLPPGPPPPQPTQPDYSAYWAAAAAAHAPPPAVGQYNPQWIAPPAPPQRPPAEQSALYANYGYGTQHTHWQRQQQQQQLQQLQAQQYHHPPPPPVAQPPPQPPAQPGYNPYQPTAGYPTQYVPQAIPAAPQQMPQGAYPHPQAQQPQQQFFPQHMQPQQQQHQPQQQRHQIHHTPPQHLPPAKRQRFDGPNPTRQSQHHVAPPQPQFQAPPPPPQNIGPYAGQGRGGAPQGMGHTAMSAGRGDYQNRRAGGSGGGGAYGHQGGSFRGRSGQGHSGSSRSGRHDGSGTSFGPRDGQASSSFGSVGKKDENRRTLTDFKIVGLEIQDLSWTWGILPSTSPLKIEAKEEDITLDVDHDIEQASQATIKEESMEGEAALQSTVEEPPPQPHQHEAPIDSDVIVADTPVRPPEPIVVKEAPPPAVHEAPTEPNAPTPPPSRIRIYFHTPVTADDARPIPHNSSFTFGAAPSDSRKGKRKKLEDDDGDLEEERARPPPPQMRGMSDDRSSVAPSVAHSVAETASEADWLMAAIVEGEEDAEAEAELDPAREAELNDAEEDAEQLHVSQIVEPHESDDPAEDAIEPPLSSTHGLHVDADMWAADSGAVVPVSTEVGHVEHDGGAPATNGTNVAPEGGDETSPAAAAAPSENETIAANSNAAAGAVVGADAGLAVASPHDGGSQNILDSSASVTAPLSSSVPTSAPSKPSVSDSIASSQNDSSVSSVEEKAADNVGLPDTQVPVSPSAVMGAIKSLLSVSAEPTLLNLESGGLPSDDGAATIVNGHGADHMDDREETGTQVGDFDVATQEVDHLPEPPASPPTSNTFLSGSSTSTFGDSPTVPLGKPVKTGRTPSANRLSISYAGGNRRLVIDAEVVESLKVFRQEGRIEVLMNILKEGDDGLKGILVEGLSDLTKSYLPLPTISAASDLDPTLPPFSKVSIPSSLTLRVYLDTARPLSEPKWAKSGDIQEWLKSMFGRMFWVAGDAAEGWEKKIHVVDPDPPPTIWTVLDGWAANSPAGVLNERQRFLKTHMAETDNILEILLRLVRGERATASYQSTPAISAPSVSGPLLQALSPASAHGAQQTHVSLAVLAIFRMAVEYAEKAVGEKGKIEVEERVGEIIRCLPSHLVYKSLDGIFKEWRVEKKGR
ncbi:hypothetical protein Hypma_009662 [Hypsizygus marmoreus]|uniref:Uncharacterized protein n=1 Tax=Hypsizygus marmoreus TaxID=39966 RepID=A0A369JU82_HYPMA|nr:hypothetical protein Hypma_009662 [Hypsizygus marmoreus]